MGISFSGNRHTFHHRGTIYTVLLSTLISLKEVDWKYGENILVHIACKYAENIDRNIEKKLKLKTQEPT